MKLSYAIDNNNGVRVEFRFDAETDETPFIGLTIERDGEDDLEFIWDDEDQAEELLEEVQRVYRLYLGELAKAN